MKNKKFFFIIIIILDMKNKKYFFIIIVLDIFGFIFPRNYLFHRLLTFISLSKLELFILCKFVNKKQRINSIIVLISWLFWLNKSELIQSRECTCENFNTMVLMKLEEKIFKKLKLSLCKGF